MKKLVLFAVLPLLIAAGCTTQYKAQAPNDDVYYSSRDVPAVTTNKVVVKQTQVPVASDNSNANPQENNDQANNRSADASQYSAYDNQPAESTTESYSEPGSDTYINNNYYDDYYDYEFASRLRRFHSNYYFPSYYNDYYTNMYWYDYNPWSWGTSIYFNSGWFGPSFGMSFGWGWPSYSYGWGGYPSYYGNYVQGYYDGYYNGYYAGNYNNNGWYNSEGGWYNDNNYYYGHRGQSGFAGGSSNGRTTAFKSSQGQGRTGNNNDLISNTNGRNIGSSTENSSLTNARNDASKISRDVAPVNGRNTEAVPANSRIQQNTQSRMSQGNASTTSPRVNPGYKQNLQQGRGRYIAPSQNRQKVTETGNNTRNSQATPQTRYSQQQNNNRTNTNVQPKGNVYRENAPRQSAQPARTYTQPGTRIQSYSSPSYSKPRSSQEYTTPKYRDMRNSGSYSQPQQRSGSNSNSPGNGAVRENTQRKSSNQSSSGSQPGRSTYSAPSRSSDNSYSAPARSSSSSSDNSSRSSSGNSSGSSSGSSRSSSSSSGSGNGRR